MLLAFLASCAVPVAPTGGPADRDPPALVDSDPGPDAVNFTRDVVSLTFSEWIDQASFQRAFSITPAPDTPPRIRWRGRRVEIHFPEPLRENTTYILTIDTDLRDMNAVALTQPISFAFATGPVIDMGVIRGEIIHPAEQRGVAGMDVFAFMLTDTTRPPALDRAPDYRTQTDAQGRFELRHLPDGPFFVAGVQDRNRNRRIDPGEPFAAPPVLAVRPVQPDTVRATFRMYRTVRDTLSPSVQTVRAVTSRRLAVRFSKPIFRLDVDGPEWRVEDAAGRPLDVEHIFLRAGDPSQVFLMLADPLPVNGLRLRPGAAVDSAGNRPRMSWTTFEGSAAPDTALARFQTFLPEAGMADEDETQILVFRQRPGIRLSEPVSKELLRAAVTVTDTLQQTLAFNISTHNYTDFFLEIDEELPLAMPFIVTIDTRQMEGDAVIERVYRRLSTDETGSLAGVVTGSDAPVTVELYRSEALRDVLLSVSLPADDASFLFGRLPEGMYRLRAFADRDTSGTWRGGSINPYRRAEPFVWNVDSLRIRARWETVADTLRIPPDSTFFFRPTGPSP